MEKLQVLFYYSLLCAELKNLSKSPTRKHHLCIHGHSNQNRTRMAWTFSTSSESLNGTAAELNVNKSYEQDLFDNWHVPFLRLCKKKFTVSNFQLPYSITNLKFVHFSSVLQLLENNIKIRSTLIEGKNLRFICDN